MYFFQGEWHPTVTEDAVLGFFKEYRFLSNFQMSYCQCSDDMGFRYPSVEHFYQAQKTLDKELRKSFAYTELEDSPFNEEVKFKSPEFETPGQAKRAGGQLSLREDWDQVKLSVMRDGLFQKFDDPQLKNWLLATGHTYLEETNYWGDKFWGVHNGKGKNELGRLLIEVRTALQWDDYTEGLKEE